jgi:uncharacterized protein YndB with AHSA1/START domain
VGSHKRDGRSTADEDYGELVRGPGRAVVRFRRRFRHPPETVWRALTEPEHLAAWFPSTIEGEHRAGAVLHFRFPDMEAPPLEGEMLSFTAPSLMELRWGDEILRFELEPHEGGTTLLFTAAFDQIGKTARDGAGWHSCLDLLGFEVDARPAPWSSADRWREVRADYIERFGTEASTVGPPEEWERVHGPAGD